MRVLLASTGSDISSGAVRCLLELASNLMEQGIEVLVTIPQKGNIEKELNKKRIPYKFIHEYHSWYTSKKHNKNHFLLKRILNYKSYLCMRKLIKKEKIDIVHENALTAFVAAWAAISLNIPVVWHIREFMEEDLQITFKYPQYSLKILNKADEFIAISQPIYDKWKKIITAPMIKINDGIPVDKYYIENKKQGNTINILLYGRIVQGKGQLFYIKGAIEAIKRVRVPCKFLWAGFIEDKEYFEECIKLIQSNHMDKFFEYKGEVSNVKALLMDTQIVCVCSKKEGFGRVTVESLLGKCLIIGANTGATTEIIQNKKNGIIYEAENINDFSEKIVDAINNYEDYCNIIKTGQENAINSYCIEKNVKSIIKIYEKLIR